MRELKIYGNNFLTARTKDGLSVNITCAFQYQLVDSLDSILDIYNKWGTEDYEEAYLRIAKGVLRESIASFTGMFVVTGRTAVEETMKAKLAEALSTSHATLRNFQLFEIVLPGEFMKAINDLENGKQQYTTATYQLQSAKSHAEGVMAQASEETSTIINEAKGFAERLNYVRMI